jgi:AraC-like DNA-binding protein
MIDLSIRVLQAGNALIEPHWWRYSIRPSRFWTIYLSDRTGIVLTMKGKLMRLPAGRVCLIPMGLEYDCHVTRNVMQAWFTFDVVHPASVLLVQLFDGVSVLEENQGLQDRVKALAQRLEFSSPITFELGLKVKSLVYEAVAAHMDGLEPGRVQAWELAGTKSDIAGALKLIEERMASPLSNRELGAACHMSEYHFIRRFTAAVGQTPARYLRDRRISKAAQFLRFSDKSIKEIAQEVGFADRFHMTRMFTRMTGKTPALYRKQAGY